jgi:hypothetical protein
MAGCTAQKQRLDEPKGELRAPQGKQQRASPQQKAGVGQALLRVRQQIATAESDLHHCLGFRILRAVSLADRASARDLQVTTQSSANLVR